MNKHKYLPYIVSIGIALIVGGLGSLAVRAGMPAFEMLEQPFFAPPKILFPIVWNILYVLMGISAVRVWRSHSRDRAPALVIYATQLGMNLLWNVWFFLLQFRLFAFFWLVGLAVVVAVMIRVFYRIDKPAGLLQIPYLIWLVFAAVLNLSIWLLN